MRRFVLVHHSVVENGSLIYERGAESYSFSAADRDYTKVQFCARLLFLPRRIRAVVPSFRPATYRRYLQYHFVRQIGSA